MFRKFVIVFIDDILVYSKNEEEHAKHLEEVLQLLREHQLYDKLIKCSFFQTQVHYLGLVVSKEDIAVDPENIRAIMEWVAPKNVAAMRYLWDWQVTTGGSSGSSHALYILSHHCSGKVRSLNGWWNVKIVFRNLSSF